MEEKLLKNGTVVKLKETYTVDDWDSWKRLDEFYSNLGQATSNSNMIFKMTRDEFRTMMKDILTDENGNELDDEVINTIGLDEGLPLMIDFFFIYNKLNLNMQSNLKSSQKRVIEQIEKLSGSKITGTPNAEKRKEVK